MHVMNNSIIAAELVVDMRFDEDKDGMDEEKDGLDCLEIICEEKGDESVIHSIHENEEEATKEE